MNISKDNIVRIECDRCLGGTRNHEVLREYVENDPIDEERGAYFTYTYQICRCLGCDSVRFRVEEEFSGYEDCTVQIYPQIQKNSWPEKPELRALEKVGSIYRETVAAFNARAMILTGAGLRAIVEALCNQRKIRGKNLQEKIDALVDENLLAKPQADLLHEERYIGNSALHEVEPPPEKDVVLGLEIVEGLLTTIFILPLKAQELREARERKSPKSNAEAEDN